jgi:transmembrane sensor
MTGDAPKSIDEQAIAWFVRLRDAEATREDRARFAAWLAADPRHRRAWREVESLWTGMDGLRPGAIAPLPFRSPNPWRRLAAAAAILLLVFAAAGLWTVPPPGYAAGLLADHRTAAGELRTVALPDGSTVTLSASTALSVAYSRTERQVVLHGGEGYFSVIADADRPFVVAAADGRVRVVGTEFDVKLAAGQTRVAVAKGLVDVATGGARPVRLEPGQAVRYGKHGIGAVHGVDTASIGAWRDGRLIFEGAPLGEVLRDLERYRSGRIAIYDDAIAGLRVTGAFDTRRPDAALDTIERTLPVKLVRLTALLVLVLPAN